MMLDYDDIGIKPVNSNILDPIQVDISFTLSEGKSTLSMPLIGRIDGKEGLGACSLLSNLGIVGIINNIEDIYLDKENNFKVLENTPLWGISVNFGDSAEKTIELMGLNPTIIELTPTDGYSYATLRLAEEIRKQKDSMNLDSLVMSGNVMTYDGAERLRSAGAEMIRVGNPGGLYFPPSIMNIPMISAMQDCWSVDAVIVAEEQELWLDRFIKVLAVGADMYMVRQLGFDYATDYVADTTNAVKEFNGAFRCFCSTINALNLEQVKYNSEITVRGGGTCM